MSGFRKKLSHTTKISLGPRDLQPLADVIATEKGVWAAYNKLGNESKKAAEALNVWGSKEGDDLSDVLDKVAQLFIRLATAHTTFADHDEQYRNMFKSIRTREESLMQLKKSKESLDGKILSLEKKISKMKEENKDLPDAQNKLRELREEMVGMNNSLAVDEAGLWDYKRSITSTALNLRLGAICEMGEKMAIVGELGKLLIECLPKDRTEPGSERPPYKNFQRSTEILKDVEECLSRVAFASGSVPGELHDGTDGGGDIEVEADQSQSIREETPIEQPSSRNQNRSEGQVPSYPSSPGGAAPMALNASEQSRSPSSHQQQGYPFQQDPRLGPGHRIGFAPPPSIPLNDYYDDRNAPGTPLPPSHGYGRGTPPPQLPHGYGHYPQQQQDQDLSESSLGYMSAPQDLPGMPVQHGYGGPPQHQQSPRGPGQGQVDAPTSGVETVAPPPLPHQHQPPPERDQQPYQGETPERPPPHSRSATTDTATSLGLGLGYDPTAYLAATAPGGPGLPPASVGSAPAPAGQQPLPPPPLPPSAGQDNNHAGAGGVAGSEQRRGSSNAPSTTARDYARNDGGNNGGGGNPVGGPGGPRQQMTLNTINTSPLGAPGGPTSPTSPSANRPKAGRGDSMLGSKYGFDLGAADYVPVGQPGNIVVAGAPSGYSYTIVGPDGSGGSDRKVSAAAFRKPGAGGGTGLGGLYSYSNAQAAANPSGGPTQAQLIRDSYRASLSSRDQLPSLPPTVLQFGSQQANGNGNGNGNGQANELGVVSPLQVRKRNTLGAEVSNPGSRSETPVATGGSPLNPNNRAPADSYAEQHSGFQGHGGNGNTNGHNRAPTGSTLGVNPSVTPPPPSYGDQDGGGGGGGGNDGGSYGVRRFVTALD